MIGAPTRQQPRQVPAEPKAAEQQFLACPSHSQWTLPGSSLNSHSCSHGQPAVQPQHASSHNLTQLSFAMHQGSKPVQHQQATGPAQHCQLSPLQWRYDQNYSSRVNRQQRQPQDDQESSSSEGVQLSCSEEFDVDEHDMQSCGVSKLRLGTSQSEEDLHAESASICNLRSEAELHQSIPEAYVHSSSSSTQAASPSNVGCSSCALQQESNCAAIACTASQRKDDERWDCERCAGVDTSHEQACASASAPQLAPIRRKSSSGKRLPQSWQTLADEMAVSPSHQAPQKRAKPDQVRKLKF